jgi:hypothetical protein
MSPRQARHQDRQTDRLTDRRSQCDSDSDSVQKESRVEAGSNTFTVALRVVGGDKKGSLKSGNMASSSTGLGPENDCAGEDQQ